MSRLQALEACCFGGLDIGEGEFAGCSTSKLCRMSPGTALCPQILSRIQDELSRSRDHRQENSGPAFKKPVCRIFPSQNVVGIDFRQICNRSARKVEQPSSTPPPPSQDLSSLSS
jgi:hypothetical protein